MENIKAMLKRGGQISIIESIIFGIIGFILYAKAEAATVIATNLIGDRRDENKAVPFPESEFIALYGCRRPRFRSACNFVRSLPAAAAVTILPLTQLFTGRSRP